MMSSELRSVSTMTGRAAGDGAGVGATGVGEGAPVAAGGEPTGADGAGVGVDEEHAATRRMAAARTVSRATRRWASTV